MESSIGSLKRVYDSCAEYIAYLNEGGWMSRRNDVSKFWADILSGDPERVNYPGFNDMLIMRRGGTYSLADSGVGSDPKVESDKAKAAYAVISQTVPEEYFREMSESVVGSPRCFEFDGQMWSAGGIVNALTAYRIIQWCQTTGLSRRPLRVLEIEPGYGQVAYQLLTQLDVESYTAVDLPENLFLGAFYIQANFPGKSARFVGEGDANGETPAELSFLAPQFLRTLAGPFDLVVNSYSFQEMNRESVEEYFGYVESRLAPGGIFYSLNSHRKSGIVWPSDYQVERFQLISMLPVRKYPHHYLLATNPYEVVMTGRTDAPGDAQTDKSFGRHFDALGAALQLGLHDELLEMCERFSQARLDSADAEWLDHLSGFFYTSSFSEKKAELKGMRSAGKLPEVVNCLDGSLEFAAGAADEARMHLEKAVDALPQSHAWVRSYAMLSCLAYRDGNRSECDSFRSEAQGVVPHLSPEIARVVEDYQGLADQIALQIYLDLPRRLGGSRGLVGRAWRRLVRS